MILEEIVKNKKKEIAENAAEEATLTPLLSVLPKPKDFLGAISKKGINLIAEIKRKSPSAGIIRKDFDVKLLAKTYEKSGARAISVLTDKKYFGGTIGDLIEVRKHTKLPILRKDFIIDRKQIYESRVAGADAILLIARILSKKNLADFLALAHKLGMYCLVEVHNKPELKKALASGAKIIGINNRNLDSLDVNLNTTAALKKIMPKSIISVSESGIKTRSDVINLANKGINAILVGESILKNGNVSKKISELIKND